ncbi:hypothetical protein L873DRAFT_1746534 [Choiromyces venosus 120613-1]|uniref:Uncharacterized protein n=1 Tax=Choiromyces venosus 120613-1 TaxID=1336337 RepID=A0A3N4J8X2_9PEZI|nr:hypothetical protein L873DRAFT_1746534 [Choiromyces venosus 120613-1]
MRSGYNGICANRRMWITCLIARWVRDISMHLCGMSGRLAFERLLPSKSPSSCPSVNQPWTQKLSTNSDSLETFFLFSIVVCSGLLLWSYVYSSPLLYDTGINRVRLSPFTGQK